MIILTFFGKVLWALACLVSKAIDELFEGILEALLFGWMG